MSLRRQAAYGAYWMGTSGAVGGALQFTTLVVLARLLEPEIFGLIAMLTVVIGFTQAYTDMGISNALIYRQDVTPEQLSSLYWLNIASGIAAYLVLVAATPLIVMLYSEPRLEELVRFAALVLLISPVGAQYRILLQKDLRFKVLASTEFAGALTGAVCSIAGALAGLGPYALIGGNLAGAIVLNASVIAVAWRRSPIRFTFHAAHLKGYISFGLYQMGERTVNFTLEKLDQLLIGSLLGPHVLGYYNVAANLVYMPLQRINPILTRVAFPLFAKVQDDDSKLKRGFMVLRGFLATVNFPLYLGLICIAPTFVPVVLGEQWAESAILIQILAIVAMLRSTGNPLGSLLLAKGRADYGFYWNLFAIFIQFPAVAIGAYFGGAVGVACSVLVAQCLFFCLGYLALVRSLIGPCFYEYLTTLGPAAISSVIMAAIVLIAGILLSVSAPSQLIMQVMIGAVAYVGIYWLLFQRSMREFIKLVLGRDIP